MGAASPARPRAWLYLPLRGLCRLIGRLFFGLRVAGREALPKEGPLLVLAAHQGMIDFLLTLAALKDRRVHFVATQRQYNNPWLHWAYRLLGVIPKVQFHSDPRCVMGMLRVLRAGGTVVVFPAGQTSMWGRPEAIPPAIAHFVRRAGAPVCLLSIRGGFFSAPRFGGLHFGRTEVKLEMAFSAEEAKALPEEDLLARLSAGLDYDEYAWQAETGAVFRGWDRAKGYETMAVCCPRCGALGAFRQKGSGIVCAKCGNAGRLGRDMRMVPVGESRIFPTLLDWRDWQEGLILPALAAGARVEEPAVCLLCHPKTLRQQPAGEGVLGLDRQALWFRGQVKGRPAELRLEHSQLSGLSAHPGHYIELYHPEFGLMRFRLACGPAVTLLKLAQAGLHRREAPAEPALSPACTMEELVGRAFRSGPPGPPSTGPARETGHLRRKQK